jgi:hypothetical protein
MEVNEKISEILEEATEKLGCITGEIEHGGAFIILSCLPDGNGKMSSFMAVKGSSAALSATIAVCCEKVPKLREVFRQGSIPIDEQFEDFLSNILNAN